MAKEVSRETTFREVGIALQGLLNDCKIDYKVELGAGVNVVFLNKAVARLRSYLKDSSIKDMEDLVDGAIVVKQITDLVKAKEA